ncbi:TetR/AcrR family transcriptional regulator C-terminal domain-containing protein [Natronosporangium hydrolyticum]|uniref:TetR/AcrR family transcriptional regulator C-terminal domain-containing protein n=1 Tax=Natronosporangium hydrolyticum TaxID=2811111 RepID=A0A895Y8G4_9ACTN|nr:TetR/AcrR family transcriptional regulator [Natronosporangium hydrolyticum]QSB14007.1 TetR/AcrR family transcriptional regulator C-terminal domain-containing protein [Natronosporangium hydrolyticum]
MTAISTSAGDPARTLALLWRDPAVISRRGPRRSLQLDDVIAAATAIAHERGLAALTMREVARALGVVPMTLYTYVPGKAELLDLMLDAAYTQLPRTDTTGRPWRHRVATVADENRALFATHPWAATISTRRPPLGPGSIAKYEHELAAFDGLGLDEVTMDDCLTYLLDFVRANAAPADGVTSPGGAYEDEWWQTAGPLLDQYVDAARYPLATRVGTAAGAAHGAAYQPEHAYRFGLARVLDGLATLIEGSRSRPTESGDAADRD